MFEQTPKPMSQQERCFQLRPYKLQKMFVLKQQKSIWARRLFVLKQRNQSEPDDICPEAREINLSQKMFVLKQQKSIWARRCFSWSKRSSIWARRCKNRNRQIEKCNWKHLYNFQKTLFRLDQKVYLLKQRKINLSQKNLSSCRPTFQSHNSADVLSPDVQVSAQWLFKHQYQHH